MPGPEAPNPNQDPMQTQAISMDAVRQAREAIQPSEAPDAMQSQAMSLAGLRKVREGLSQISDVAPALYQQVKEKFESYLTPEGATFYNPQRVDLFRKAA